MTSISKRQRLTATLFILFFAILAGLTFFSSTLETMMLPKVITEKLVSKTLVHSVNGSGVLTPRKQVDLVNESGSKILKVYVKENDQVKKGQKLVTFDSSELDEQLYQEEMGLKKQKLNREVLKENIMNAVRAGDEQAIVKAQRDLELDNMDLEMATRKLNKLHKDKADKQTLTAPFDGKITKITAEDSMNGSQGGTILTLMDSGKGFEFLFAVDSGNTALFEIGSKVSVRLVKDNKLVDGTIQEIKTAKKENSGDSSKDSPNESSYQVVVSITDGGLKGGEQASLDIKKESNDKGFVLPKKWIHKDATGSYVYVVEEKKSSLGNTFNARKAYILTGDSTEDEVIAVSGLSSNDEIIIESSEPLQEGNRIRVY
ncbi:RND transporter [Paenibacillus baekrokdamisoli]|uniref:RND transporter n=1 Tax=Paenibacillus baekrokdamisoli TaxID=1712516 RepID=A0A3G9JCD5_9BACL|nr:efflux RND transporter periplasmic adaptor subunit [Paenibacillus baekrokdamisoli]MBB3068769.1 RND family efflux transporter MFP subunit [Paenibacillus baekrokdamisoli]BBH23601.1 RND transporter [Paenibacillus baekrokdamisoli]